MENMLESARRCFTAYYGEDAKLKSFQLETLGLLASGKNVFAGLPTGYGKSLCYWLPAKAWNWRVIVISPLVSLMNDQKVAAEKFGIETIAYFSGQDLETRKALDGKFFSGDWNICILSPERLTAWRESAHFSNLLSIGLDLVVLDEMHCLDDWRDFRQGYFSMFEPMKRLTAKGISLLGLSASMPMAERNIWMRDLCDNPHFIHTELGRKNLFLQIVPIEEESHRWMLLLHVLRNLRAPTTALIYCSTRAEVDDLTRWLSAAGISAVAYHARIPPIAKKIRAKSFRDGNLRVVCCTSAFGMGIDYPHVKIVIHFSTPSNLNSYWQEVGRAGRSGEKASAICFLRRSEILRARKMNKAQKKAFYEMWQAFISTDCRKVLIGRNLGIEEQKCGSCDNCARSERGVFSSEMQEMDFFLQKNIWWMESGAEIEVWVREKIFVD